MNKPGYTRWLVRALTQIPSSKRDGPYQTANQNERSAVSRCAGLARRYAGTASDHLNVARNRKEFRPRSKLRFQLEDLRVYFIRRIVHAQVIEKHADTVFGGNFQSGPPKKFAYVR